MADPAQTQARDGGSRARAAAGEIEVDECYIGGFEPGKQGRGTGEKALVGIAIEVRGRGSGRVRLRALPDVSGATLRAFVTDAVAAGAIVHTDGWQGYRPLGKAGYDHHRRSQRAAGPAEDPILPRAHRAISNLKLWLAGTHRGVSNEHIQVYLDEFVFRHNRRHTPLAAFQTLLGLSASHAPTTYDQITRRTA